MKTCPPRVSFVIAFHFSIIFNFQFIFQLLKMILDDLNKTRQMMLKNSGSTRAEPVRADPTVCTDQRSLSLLAELNNSNHMTTWVANNSTYNNPILPVFPRFEDEPKKEESTSNA